MCICTLFQIVFVRWGSAGRVSLNDTTTAGRRRKKRRRGGGGGVGGVPGGRAQNTMESCAQKMRHRGKQKGATSQAVGRVCLAESGGGGVNSRARGSRDTGDDVCIQPMISSSDAERVISSPRTLRVKDSQILNLKRGPVGRAWSGLYSMCA